MSTFSPLKGRRLRFGGWEDRSGLSPAEESWSSLSKGAKIFGGVLLESECYLHVMVKEKKEPKCKKKKRRKEK